MGRDWKFGGELGARLGRLRFACRRRLGCGETVDSGGCAQRVKS